MFARLSLLPRNTVIVHGAASSGGDALADRAAARLGFGRERFPADWRRHGRRAGILRNLEMLNEHPDLVIAFWDGHSNGTWHMIEEARRRGITVEVIEREPLYI